MMIQAVTLFPEMYDGVLGSSMLRRARRQGIVETRVIPLRPFGIGPHRQTDDYPFGGGVGMLLRCDVVVAAVEWAMMHATTQAHVVLTSPQGRRFSQKTAEQFSRLDHLIIIAGHYEGIDERVRVLLDADEVSIGDYVLTGGELPSLVMIDATVRLLTGALGAASGAHSDSFSRGGGWLEGPQYTRPDRYRGYSVPAILTTGNHAAVTAYQEKMAQEWTAGRRPDLLNKQREGD